jgi:uncharacterized protein (TIGR03435 family)
MMSPAPWIESSLAALVNHLWQSTVVILAAWLLTFALRSHPARVRHWVWMTASAKFLLPFSLLISLGSHWAHPRTGIKTGSALYTAMDEISRPYAPLPTHAAGPSIAAGQLGLTHWMPLIAVVVWLGGSMAVFGVWFARWTRAVKIAQRAIVLASGRELEALRRVERDVGWPRPMPLLLLPITMEPGVFGIWHPALLWPAGISGYLDDAQLDSIFAHELAHVRRRDNLAAAAHMLVEALFWFHPLVWWLGDRLTDERERACDEDVLQLRPLPAAYAESILKVCKFCLESPLPCVSGVTGSDLKKRITRIMANRPGAAPGLDGKIAWAAAALLMLTLPLGFGILHAMQAPAQLLHADKTPGPTFEVATIKPNNDTRPGLLFQLSPTGFKAHHASLKDLVRFAYAMKSDNQAIGAPSWWDSEFFDVEAKEADADVEAAKPLPMDTQMNQLRLRVQSLLAERFQFRTSFETRELPVYALVVAQGGIKMKEVQPDPPPRPGIPAPPGAHLPQLRMTAPNQFTAIAWPIEEMTDWLSRFDELGSRIVVNETGLTGHYDWVLNGVSQRPQQPADPNSSAPSQPAISLFTALAEQLGLKLEPRRAPVEVLVIDHVEQPSPN